MTQPHGPDWQPELHPSSPRRRIAGRSPGNVLSTIAHDDLFGVALVLLVYILLGLAYGSVTPPFENLDESEHFGVVRYIVDTGQLPISGTSVQGYHTRQEVFQPPLYHVLSAGLVQLLRLPTDDPSAFTRPNPQVACGSRKSDLYDNRAKFYHDPHQESFPWQGALLTLHVLRAWSTLLQSVTVVGVYVLGRLTFPRRRGIPLLATGVVAFNPQFLLTASAVTNDNLVTPVTTIGLCLILQMWRKKPSGYQAAGLGVVIGLAGLAKLSGWLLLALVGLAILAMVIRSREQWRRLFGTAALIVLMSLGAGGWWFWRNWITYHDPTALRPMLALVGSRASAIAPLADSELMFRSFWGQIPCAPFPPGFNIFYGVLLALSLVGLLWGWRQLASTERRGVAFLVAWFLIVVISWARWDMVTAAPWGRLLFPALPAVGLLIAAGINRLAAGPFVIGRRIVLIVLALLAWWTAARILPAFFAPPPRYRAVNALRPSHPLNARLGNSIRLLGYDVTLENSGPALDLTLYWQALASMTEDYVLTIQLVSPVPGDTSVRLNYNSWPGRGNYPTSAWQPGEIIQDRYRLVLPKADWPTRAWDVHIFFSHDGERLPMRADDDTVVDQPVLTQVRIPGRSPTCSKDGRLASSVQFGQAIALTHSWVISDTGQTQVILCWKAMQPVSTNYTVLVHAYDASGALIAVGDGPPMQDAFPTSQWRPGDVILDAHNLPVSIRAETTVQRIAVGFYDPSNGSRSSASVGDEPAPDATVTIWPNRP
jgi:4-amino-4-deoxy-L-arabinose transferase-like glycosyltransferase